MGIFKRKYESPNYCYQFYFIDMHRVAYNEDFGGYEWVGSMSYPSLEQRVYLGPT